VATKRRELKISASSHSSSFKNAKKRRRSETVKQIEADHSYCSRKHTVDTEGLLAKASKKLKLAQRKILRLKKKVSNLHDMLKSIKRKFKIEDHVEDILKQSGAEIPKALFGRMTKNLSSKKTSGEAYPAALKTFALTLHFHSPKAYR
jgi:hypothetical protein